MVTLRGWSFWTPLTRLTDAAHYSSMSSALACRGRGSARQVAAGFLPFLTMMSTFPAAGYAAQLLPRRWARVWEGAMAVEDRHHQSTLPGRADDSGALGLGEDLIEDDDPDMVLG